MKLVIVGDQALTEGEYAARLEQRAREAARHKERMATDPEYAERYRARRRADGARYRQRHRESYRAVHREWNRRKRAALRADATGIRTVASLHDLRCTGPTKATGCRCHKVTIYERVERAA